jgi:hypothetical protein
VKSALALLRELRRHGPQRPAPISPRAVAYSAIYATVAADTGTAEDLAAFSAAYDAGARDLPERLAELEADCERLGREGASEREYRQAVEALVNLVRHIREAHQAAQQAEPGSPAPDGPLLAGIADPCLICGGSTYHLPGVNGWVYCADCYAMPPITADPRIRR